MIQITDKPACEPAPTKPQATKPCPFCAKPFFSGRQCRYCGEFLDQPRRTPKSRWIFSTSAVVLGLLTLGPLALPWFGLTPLVSDRQGNHHSCCRRRHSSDVLGYNSHVTISSDRSTVSTVTLCGCGQKREIAGGLCPRFPMGFCGRSFQWNRPVSIVRLVLIVL